MKLLTIAAALLMSVNLFAAVNKYSSWSDIDAAYNVQIDSMTSTEAVDGVSVSVFNLCKAGNKLRTVQPVTYCARFDVKFVCENGSKFCKGENKQKVVTCAESVTRHLIGGDSKKKCVKRVKMGGGEPAKCVAYEIVERQVPSAYNIDVLYTTGDRKHDTAFTKTYELPQCAG
ncbi:MAG: hypothetical protein MK008_13480 [Bdellovibrionales bacterium]|nr:hypothetical protein [Bdellovibrionales bacterium]